MGYRQQFREWMFGCAALERVDSKVAGIVVMFGDQSRTNPATVRRLATERPATDIVVCRCDDGIDDLSIWRSVWASRCWKVRLDWVNNFCENDCKGAECQEHTTALLRWVDRERGVLWLEVPKIGRAHV